MMKGCFSVEYLILSNNFKMFMVGFGVFKVIDKEECQQLVLSVICSGYCFIDIVVVYGNEDVVGDVVCEVIVIGLCICEELFIIFKLWV